VSYLNVSVKETLKEGTKQLRGCIGYPEPILPLAEATISSAINSATKDPRFLPISTKELENILMEVSVLTPPELIVVKNPKEYIEKIEIGRDGIVVERGAFKGLLLPQVPIEQNWDEKEFLSNTCMKAWLPPDAWLDESTIIYKFRGQIFTEIEPEGEIKEKNLDGSDS